MKVKEGNEKLRCLVPSLLRIMLVKNKKRLKKQKINKINKFLRKHVGNTRARKKKY